MKINNNSSLNYFYSVHQILTATLFGLDHSFLLFITCPEIQLLAIKSPIPSVFLFYFRSPQCGHSPMPSLVILYYYLRLQNPTTIDWCI